MIGHKYQGDIFRDIIQIFEFVGCPQKLCTKHQKKVQIIDTFFVGLIAEKIETHPLYRMKNNQTKAKTQIINNGYGVRN